MPAIAWVPFRTPPQHVCLGLAMQSRRVRQRRYVLPDRLWRVLVELEFDPLGLMRKLAQLPNQAEEVSGITAGRHESAHRTAAHHEYVAAHLLRLRSGIDLSRQLRRKVDSRGRHGVNTIPLCIGLGNSCSAPPRTVLSSGKMQRRRCAGATGPRGRLAASAVRPRLSRSSPSRSCCRRHHARSPGRPARRARRRR